MKLQILNPKWRHSNVTLPLCSTADIFHVITFRRGEQFSVWLASCGLTPASSYRVVLLSSGRTFITFLYIASSLPRVFQPQTERSSTPFIALLSFRQCHPSLLWLQHLPVNMKNGKLLKRRALLDFLQDVLDVNPLVKRG